MTPGQELSPSYNLGSLLLLTTLVAVVLGVTVHAPGWGILLMLFAVPPFIRTALIVGRLQRRGVTASLGRKAILYLDSVGIMFAFGVMTTLTLFATSFIMGTVGVPILAILGVASGYLAATTVLLSLLASLVVLVKMALVLWPYQEDE